jgi:hypothetical protein
LKFIIHCDGNFGCGLVASYIGPAVMYEDFLPPTTDDQGEPPTWVGVAKKSSIDLSSG